MVDFLALLENFLSSPAPVEGQGGRNKDLKECNPCKRGHNDPPYSFSLNLFAHPFLRKNYMDEETFTPIKFEKKIYMGGHPKHRTWPKSKKKYKKI